MPLDQAELFFEPGLHFFGDAAVAAHGCLVAQVFQVGLGSEPLGHRIIGELVVQVFGEVEGTPVRYLDGVLDGLRAFAKQVGHFLGRLQVKLVAGAAFRVGLLQALVMLDGHQDVLEAVALRGVVVDVVGGYHAHAQAAGQLNEPPVALGVALDQVLLQLHKDVFLAEPLQVLLQGFLGFPLLFGGLLWG